ncbi:MAG: UDP-2,3-diacylglucosamine diphosphatase LpxI [Anaerohalosphaeraceae bacterium]|nr:UDP-2,3-diacylglucosamine diphosphatase LpxI [Anaerohalosphaeraceae bacterium]
MNEQKTLGLIAGGGRLPFLVAMGAKANGLKVVCVGLGDNPEEGLSQCVDVFKTVPLARPGSWIRALRKYNVTDTIMVGKVQKAKLYTPQRILRYLPDWRALRVYYWRLKKRDKRDDTILGALADELASGGIILKDSTKYCKEYLAGKGVLTSTQPGSSVKEDIEFGWQLVKKLGELDIGQAIAVKERAVIAVEAIEGTAQMIIRAGQYCEKGGWTLLKAEKLAQDNRFDVPCIGPDTIRSLAENNGKCIVVEAGKTLILDKPETIELANSFGIAILGH